MARKPKNTYKVSNKQINFDYKPGETDAQYYKRLAKAADQRLVRIEELSGLRGKPPVKGFENAYKYAYRAAIDSLDKGIRFNANIPKPGTFEWRERVNAMRKFLSSPTSTKTGIREVYEKRVQSINDKYGTKFDWQSLADFFEKGDFDKLNKDFASKTVVRAIGKIQRAQEMLKDKLTEHAEKMKAGPEDEVALSILRRRSLSTYKNMTPEEREELRKLIRNL